MASIDVRQRGEFGDREGLWSANPVQTHPGESVDRGWPAARRRIGEERVRERFPPAREHRLDDGRKYLRIEDGRNGFMELQRDQSRLNFRRWSKRAWRQCEH